MTPELFDSGVPRKASDVLADLYHAAADRLRQTVLNPWGRTQTSREFRQARAAALTHQVDRLVTDLKGKGLEWIHANVPQAFVDGIARADQQARDAGVRVPASGLSGSFHLIDRRTVEVFARDIAADLNKAAGSMGEVARRALRATAQQHLEESDIDKILAGGVIEGRPTHAIRQLREELRAVAGDRVRIIDKNGDPIEFDVGYYASMVARTRTREATVRARHQRLGELGLDLVAIVGLISRNFCSAYLGQVFSLGGKSGKYPSIGELPGGGPPSARRTLRPQNVERT